MAVVIAGTARWGPLEALFVLVAYVPSIRGVWKARYLTDRRVYCALPDAKREPATLLL